MKLADSLRNRFGDDKLLHFLVFGLVVAFGCFFGIGLIAFLGMSVLAYIKEQFLDESFSLRDFIAGVLGGIVALALHTIASL